MSEASVIEHRYGYGPHKCRRGHSFKVKFETGSKGLISGYVKVCQRCGKEELRELTRHANKVISQRNERVSFSSSPDIGPKDLL